MRFYDMIQTASRSKLSILKIESEIHARNMVRVLSENETAALLLEWVVALLGKSLHQDVAVSVLLHVLHDLRHGLGHRHTMYAGLDSELFNELTLSLKTFLELAHDGWRLSSLQRSNNNT